MGSMNARAGDFLQCRQCGHKRELTTAGIREIVEKNFPGRKDFTLYVSELKRFKCSACGAKDPKLIERQSAVAAPVASTSSDGKWTPCHQCGGDGGAGGRCPRCGGNGFEPQ